MRIKKRHAAVGLLATGLMVIASGFLLESTAGANPVFNETQWDAHLADAHHGASNVTFKKGDCPAAPQGKPFGWHFVLKGSDTNFATLAVSFQGAGTLNPAPFVSSPTGKHAFVYTAGADVLVDAVANTTGGDEDEFVLSHVCGTPTSSSSSSSVSSSSTSQTSSSESSESSVSSSSTSQSSSEGSSVSSSSTSRTTTSSTPSSSVSSSSEVSSTSEETSSEESESSPIVSGSESSNVPTSQATSSPTVSGVQVLPQTGIDPGFLLMLGGMLVISGVLLMRYSSDPT